MASGKRGRTSNEEGLRELGDRINEQSARAQNNEPSADPVGAADDAAGSSGETVGTSEEPAATGGDPSRAASGDAKPVANEAGLAALGDQIEQSSHGRAHRRHSSKKSKRRHRIRVGVMIGAVVLLLIVGGGAGYAYYLAHDLNRIQVRGLHGALTTGQEAGTENILMVGSTSRCALTVQNPAYGLCSQGVNGVNSDVIMILHVDPAKHQMAILSIPRDLFIPNARAEGPNKVDAGLYQGVTQLVSAIEEDFGIPIQHTVSLNFDQFANVVDALGGINMNFPMSVFDAYSGLNVQAASCVHLNGTQALQVVRARHLQYDAPGTESSYAENWPQESLSDLARIRRDHEFLRVLGSAVAAQGLGNPITDLNLINSVKADLTFDQDWAVSDMVNLVLDFHSVNVNSVPQLTLPVSVVTDPDGAGGGLQYQGGSYGDVEFASQSQDLSAVDQVLGVGANTNTLNGEPLPSPSSVNVSVVNGTGTYNQAGNTAFALATLGFHTVGTSDISPLGDVVQTVVYYGSKSPAVEAAAERVVHSMSGSVIMGYDPSQVTDGAEVTVVTGTQFAVNAPPAQTTPSSTASSSSDSASASNASTAAVPATTTPTTAPSSSAIEKPSPTTSGLQPWDPRNCAPGATPTAPVANQT
jgi:LCP family protein required for cell wall assembly